jgi:hypothetical protein
MATVDVVPQQFTMVLFEADRIARVAADVIGRVGLPSDQHVRVEVDEQSPLGRAVVQSIEPLVIRAESGAFEDAKHLRHLSEQSVTDVLSRLLLRVKDRLDPAFGDPPPDSKLSVQQHTAWDAYAVGRAERMGLVSQRPRRRYHFLNRHGFTDVAEEAFCRLWDGDGLTWADLEAASAEALAANQPAQPSG